MVQYNILIDGFYKREEVCNGDGLVKYFGTKDMKNYPPINPPISHRPSKFITITTLILLFFTKSS
jgi:hypothetical protein